MTTKDAILKLANAVSGNTSENVVTDVQALAVLAQAMTGSVPAEPLATVDDAIGYIADNYSGSGGGGGGENVEFFVIGPNALAGTFTIGGNPVTFEDFSGEEFSGKKASVPNGSMVLFTPAQGATTNVASVTWWADAQDFYDDGTFIGTADVLSTLDGYAFGIAGVTSFNSYGA